MPAMLINSSHCGIGELASKGISYIHTDTTFPGQGHSGVIFNFYSKRAREFR